MLKKMALGRITLTWSVKWGHYRFEQSNNEESVDKTTIGAWQWNR